MFESSRECHRKPHNFNGCGVSAFHHSIAIFPVWSLFGRYTFNKRERRKTLIPKLKESEEQKRDKLFKALLAKNMTLCGYNHHKDLAPGMHMHVNTLNYKISDPDKFTRKELRRLFTLLKFTDEEKGQVM